MGNPIYRHGPIGYEAAAKLEKGRLVRINAEKKVEYAGAEGAVFGAVTDVADPNSFLAPDDIAVYFGTSTVELIVSGGDASGIKAGQAVYAAANGEVAGTGTVQVGVAIDHGTDGRIKAVLNKCPVAGETGV